MIITSPPKRYGVGPRLVLLLVSIVSFAALAFFWSTRNVYLDLYMIPFWAFFLSSYLYWGIYVNRLRGLHFALLPIALLAVVEIAWGSLYQFMWHPQQRLVAIISKSPEDPAGTGVLQWDVDKEYGDLFAKIRFFADGLRAYVLPANVQRGWFPYRAKAFEAVLYGSNCPFGGVGGVRLAGHFR
jgi:hypothetical protein